MEHGYSGTPLARKLGLKAGHSVWLRNAPDHYWALFSDLPDDLVKVDTDPAPESVDFIHLFCRDRAALEAAITDCKKALKKNGLLWVSWPKGKSPLAADLNREGVREYVLAIGLVDVKVAAVDADWSGLKFVYRTKDR